MPEVSVIVPTFNENENISILVERLGYVLAGEDYEVIVVDDDSEDGTAGVVRDLAQRDRHVRLIHRIGRRGLSSACIEGMLASTATYFAVMDADLQHDEQILPEMLDAIRRGGVDLVIGSRNANGGSMGEFAPSRLALSDAGRHVAALVSEARISDPMSGYFVLTRAYFDSVVRSLSGRGFKILLDLLSSSPTCPKVCDVPYKFRNRMHGESKLNIAVGVEYLRLILDKTVGKWLPVSYVLFASVGTIGLAFHLTLVYLGIHAAGLQLAVAQTISSVIVIAINFFLNNEFTFRSVRLRRSGMLWGLSMFYGACLIGLVSNVEFASYLSSFHVPWQAASFAGVVVGSVWNYNASTVGIWSRSRTQKHPIAGTASASAA